ncbi:hypothetical protein HYU17_01575 [Candidatus Woesearchaeota archaeon]|nr:hypothetical protein [Candidatus Woesearchaeota archaeon]
MADIQAILLGHVHTLRTDKPSTELPEGLAKIAAVAPIKAGTPGEADYCSLGKILYTTASISGLEAKAYPGPHVLCLDVHNGATRVLYHIASGEQLARQDKTPAAGYKPLTSADALGNVARGIGGV